MVSPSHRADEVTSRGRELYERSLRSRLEPAHNGEYLILNVDTGEYELDPDDAAASKRAKSRFPDAPLLTIRVGHTTAYRIGARGLQGS